MPSKVVSQETASTIRALKASGLSRAAIAREAGVSERQVSKALGKVPEQRTGTGISRFSSEIRESYVKNARNMGLSTAIRGNKDYQFFRQEIRDIEKQKAFLQSSLGKLEGGREYARQRIETYYKFGLISDEQKDKYLGRR